MIVQMVRVLVTIMTMAQSKSESGTMIVSLKAKKVFLRVTTRAVLLMFDEF